MENNFQYGICCAACERAGLYYTCINSHLRANEVAYILDNSCSRLLMTSLAHRDAAIVAMNESPAVECCLVVDGVEDNKRIRGWKAAVGDFPTSPIDDESLGAPMLYSSGTTGRPKGIYRPLPDARPGDVPQSYMTLDALWRYRDGMVYLSPAPLYHSAPNKALNLAIRRGATTIVMETFDAEAFLALIDQWRITHTQVVPTMFSRLLKLPRPVRDRHSLKSLEVVLHAAAPCPAQIKDQMIQWLGPVIDEYYGATEGIGFTYCNSHEWLEHRGTVGRAVSGKMHILDNTMTPAPVGQIGTIWFEIGNRFEYFRDPVKTAESRSPDGTMVTTGDIGYLDSDGYLYLTDRAEFMIISGGVNIYPQECENLLHTHPKVDDAAVFGVPNEDLGEEVKAIVQPAAGVTVGPDLESELISFCREHLASIKAPRSVDFVVSMPRLPNGKLYKKSLRDAYWLPHKIPEGGAPL